MSLKKHVEYLMMPYLSACCMHLTVGLFMKSNGLVIVTSSSPIVMKLNQCQFTIVN